MRKAVVAAALATTVLATPALARDGQGYFGADLGVTQVNDVDIAIRGVNAVTVDHEMGYELGAFLGHDFGMLRTEIEVAYKEYEPDTLVAGAPGVPQFTANRLRTGTFSAGRTTQFVHS